MNFLNLHAAYPNGKNHMDTNGWDSVPVKVPLQSILYVRAALPDELSDNVQSVVVLHGQRPDLLVRESLGLIEAEIANEHVKQILNHINQQSPIVNAFKDMVRSFGPPPSAHDDEDEGEDY